MIEIIYLIKLKIIKNFYDCFKLLNIIKKLAKYINYYNLDNKEYLNQTNNYVEIFHGIIN